MTIQGAVYELEQMLSRTDIPDYLKPTIKKVIETIVDEVKPSIQLEEEVKKLKEQKKKLNKKIKELREYKKDYEELYYNTGWDKAPDMMGK